MFIEEAKWIKSVLQEKNDNEISPILNIGSSTLVFRSKTQPFIEREIFLPLKNRAVDVFHADLESDIGVDLVGDLTDDAFVASLEKRKFKFVICSNLLEHLESSTRNKICSSIYKILEKDGLAIITVPYLYPYHEDPIDTWFRPNTKELLKLFPDFKLEISLNVKNSKSFFSELMEIPKNGILTIIKLFLPFYKFKDWQNNIRYLPFWFRRYEVTCVLIKRIN